MVLYPLGGWGIGIVIHGLTTFPFGIFGKSGKNERLKSIWRKISEFIFGMYEYKSLQSNA